MVSHLAIFAEAADRSGGIAALTAAADQSLSVSGDNVKVPSLTPKIAAVYCADTAPTVCQLRAPSMGATSELDVEPLNLGATEPLSPATFLDLRGREVELVPGENLQAWEINGGNTQGVIGVWFTDGDYSIPAGKVEYVRYTAAITAIAHTYVAGAITLSQQLNAGRYACIGFNCISTTNLLSRLIFPGQGPRPGVLGQDAIQDLQAQPFMHGSMGVLGEFEHDEPPQLEVFCTTTDSAESGILEVIKIG